MRLEGSVDLSQNIVRGFSKADSLCNSHCAAKFQVRSGLSPWVSRSRCMDVDCSVHSFYARDCLKPGKGALVFEMFLPVGPFCTFTDERAAVSPAKFFYPLWGQSNVCRCLWSAGLKIIIK